MYNETATGLIKILSVRAKNLTIDLRFNSNLVVIRYEQDNKQENNIENLGDIEERGIPTVDNSFKYYIERDYNEMITLYIAPKYADEYHISYIHIEH